MQAKLISIAGLTAIGRLSIFVLVSGNSTIIWQRSHQSYAILTYLDMIWACGFPEMHSPIRKVASLEAKLDWNLISTYILRERYAPCTNFHNKTGKASYRIHLSGMHPGAITCKQMEMLLLELGSKLLIEFWMPAMQGHPDAMEKGHCRRLGEP